MVKITDYKNYWDHMAADITGLKSAVMVANEAQLKEKLKDITDFPILVYTIPSATPASRDSDNTARKNSGLIFVLFRADAQDKSDAYYMQYMAETQQIIETIETYMISDFQVCESDYHQIMAGLDVNSFNQDPEYNYLGCDGWSLSFKFVTE